MSIVQAALSLDTHTAIPLGRSYPRDATAVCIIYLVEGAQLLLLPECSSIGTRKTNSDDGLSG